VRANRVAFDNDKDEEKKVVDTDKKGEEVEKKVEVWF
jgi:hypothetical protein